MNSFQKLAYEIQRGQILRSKEAATTLKDVQANPLHSTVGGAVGLLGSASLANVLSKGRTPAGNLAALATVLAGTGFGAMEGARVANNSQGLVGDLRKAIRDLQD